MEPSARRGPRPFEGTREQMLAHPAVQAWRRLVPGRAEPTRVDILRERERAKQPRKSRVYRLVGVGRDGSDVVAKRCQRVTAELEHHIYTEVLPKAPVRTLHCYGRVEGEEPEVCWLFLEDAAGVPYSPCAPEHRVLAARWLGHMHATAVQRAARATLPEVGPPRYLAHLRSARSTLVDNLDASALGPDARAGLQRILARFDALEARWDQVEAWCEGMPRTLVHGDFVGKNVHVRTGPAGGAILPFDWEVAGWGVPAIDLAQPALETTRFLAAPDLATYSAVVREHGRELPQDVLRRVATCGKVFRCLAALDWKAQRLGRAASDESMPIVQCFDAELTEALETGGWA